MKQQILDWIEEDRGLIVGFLRDFVRAKSPNPPGDTRAAMEHIRDFLDAREVAYDLVVRDETMPNLMASRSFQEGGKHLVLNGHIDVFPAEEDGSWIHPPWEGRIVDDVIHGRGIADMKVGTTASIMTFLYLSRLSKMLHGRLTLTVVSDEETFGPNGSRHLFENCPERVTGTACLNGEPSSAQTVRFGEKGTVWLRFEMTTAGGHGAYPHLGENAIDRAFALIQELREFTHRDVEESEAIAALLGKSGEMYDIAYGEGAAEVARSITMNVGTMQAGPKVNMVASRCTFEVDFRLPVGMACASLLEWIDSLSAMHAFSYVTLLVNESNWISPDNELTAAVKRNARSVTGIEPADVIGLGNTDARLWRYRRVPAVVYGPTPRGMGGNDEQVPIEEALNVVRVHALSAFDYLSNKGA
ncbi:M20/M25/M40 family metallo-hydrolase [Billgrantia endophytica]|uniref:Peptidase n=1 Tax=Billgrantia endophytica TaxID=2033802 RepID=A0A2N7U9U9_9GAMM|nr:M20/M25/M40 family metallo-hydrolase [Halomonas endophytica]PMR77216.1 peptidase [Halomonas endophytica]